LIIFDALEKIGTPIRAYDHLLDHDDLYDGQAPTMEHIVADLIRAQDLNVVDQDVGHGTQSHKEQVIVSMWKAGFASSENSDVKLFTVPDLPFHPEGSGKCGIGLAKRFFDLAVPDTDSPKGSWSSTLCPPGSITDLHWDYHGGSQVILGVCTNKLWLFWPPTKSNLSWWKNHNLRPTTSFNTVEAIHHLEGLTFLHQRGRQAFFMPPYHIHAVMTFEVSAHSGTPIWDFKDWKDTAKTVTEWECDWARDYFDHGYSESDAHMTFEYLLHAMKRWDKLHKKLVKSKRGSKPDLVEFGDWVKSQTLKVQQNMKLVAPSSS
jgi:hypothetical protein